jgi:hypothetical protein
MKMAKEDWGIVRIEAFGYISRISEEALKILGLTTVFCLTYFNCAFFLFFYSKAPLPISLFFFPMFASFFACLISTLIWHALNDFIIPALKTIQIEKRAR